MTPPSSLPCRRNPLAIVAIPANDEEDRIEACLAALATQRDAVGAPVPRGCFEILVLANNCSDATAALVEAFARRCVHPVSVITETLPSQHSNAGWARKRAMDLAASRLLALGQPEGLILTTDADSVVSPVWLDATLRAFAQGADCVAGYIDAHPAEMLRLNPAFVERGRLEDTYLRTVAEIYAVCDPKPHDPWPNHRVSSGASLAVRLSAYLAIGGLPPEPVGEDAALTRALERGGFRVRHSMEVSVSTSCRFDGRAKGGAADTMRHRHEVVEAPCDDDLEPALPLVRRALLKGYLRRLHERNGLGTTAWWRRLRLERETATAILASAASDSFEAWWALVSAASPALRSPTRLRPADLPHEIVRAEMCLRALRRSAPSPLKPASTRAANAIAA